MRLILISLWVLIVGIVSLYCLSVLPLITNLLYSVGLNLDANVLLFLCISLFSVGLLMETFILSVIFHVVAVITEKKFKNLNIFMEISLTTLVINFHLLSNAIVTYLYGLTPDINDIYTPLYQNPFMYIAIALLLYRLLYIYKFSVASSITFTVVLVLFKFISFLIGYIVNFL